MAESRGIRIALEGGGDVAGLLRIPAGAHSILVLAHGAGAEMDHPFMEATAAALAHRQVATLRYQFPYMEAGRKRPDRPAVAMAAVRAAVTAARASATGLRLLAGGKSFGGRMTSSAEAESPLPGVAGLVFLGFPLHAAGRPGTARAEHLTGVHRPMLFVQGTRDRLADLDLLRPLLDRLGDRARLHEIEGADHSFRVLKRSGRDEEDVLAEVADVVAAFARSL